MSRKGPSRKCKKPRLDGTSGPASPATTMTTTTPAPRSRRRTTSPAPPRFGSTTPVTDPPATAGKGQPRVPLIKIEKPRERATKLGAPPLPASKPPKAKLARRPMTHMIKPKKPSTMLPPTAPRKKKPVIDVESCEEGSSSDDDVLLLKKKSKINDFCETSDEDTKDQVEKQAKELMRLRSLLERMSREKDESAKVKPDTVPLVATIRKRGATDIRGKLEVASIRKRGATDIRGKLEAESKDAPKKASTTAEAPKPPKPPAVKAKANPATAKVSATPASAAMAARPTKAGWEMRYSTTHKRCYFFELETGAAQWNEPSPDPSAKKSTTPPMSPGPIPKSVVEPDFGYKHRRAQIEKELEAARARGDRSAVYKLLGELLEGQGDLNLVTEKYMGNAIPKRTLIGKLKRKGPLLPDLATTTTPAASPSAAGGAAATKDVTTIDLTGPPPPPPPPPMSDHIWVEAQTMDGKRYWYNKQTLETTWDAPQLNKAAKFDIVEVPLISSLEDYERLPENKTASRWPVTVLSANSFTRTGSKLIVFSKHEQMSKDTRISEDLKDPRGGFVVKSVWDAPSSEDAILASYTFAEMRGQEHIFEMKVSNTSKTYNSDDFSASITGYINATGGAEIMSMIKRRTSGKRPRDHEDVGRVSAAKRTKGLRSLR